MVVSRVLSVTTSAPEAGRERGQVTVGRHTIYGQESTHFCFVILFFFFIVKFTDISRNRPDCGAEMLPA